MKRLLYGSIVLGVAGSHELAKLRCNALRMERKRLQKKRMMKADVSASTPQRAAVARSVATDATNDVIEAGAASASARISQQEEPARHAAEEQAAKQAAVMWDSLSPPPNLKKSEKLRMKKKCEKLRIYPLVDGSDPDRILKKISNRKEYKLQQIAYNAAPGFVLKPTFISNGSGDYSTDDESGTGFLSTVYLENAVSLHQYMIDHEDDLEALRDVALRNVLTQLKDAIALFNENDFEHGDLDADGNIMVKDGLVFIIDFDLSSVTATPNNIVFGCPQSLPEDLRAEFAHILQPISVSRNTHSTKTKPQISRVFDEEQIPRGLSFGGFSDDSDSERESDGPGDNGVNRPGAADPSPVETHEAGASSTGSVKMSGVQSALTNVLDPAAQQAELGHVSSDEPQPTVGEDGDAGPERPIRAKLVEGVDSFSSDSPSADPETSVEAAVEMPDIKREDAPRVVWDNLLDVAIGETGSEKESDSDPKAKKLSMNNAHSPRKYLPFPDSSSCRTGMLAFSMHFANSYNSAKTKDPSLLKLEVTETTNQLVFGARFFQKLMKKANVDAIKQWLFPEEIARKGGVSEMFPQLAEADQDDAFRRRLMILVLNSAVIQHVNLAKIPKKYSDEVEFSEHSFVEAVTSTDLMSSLKSLNLSVDDKSRAIDSVRQYYTGERSFVDDMRTAFEAQIVTEQVYVDQVVEENHKIKWTDFDDYKWEVTCKKYEVEEDDDGNPTKYDPETEVLLTETDFVWQKGIIGNKAEKNEYGKPVKKAPRYYVRRSYLRGTEPRMQIKGEEHRQMLEVEAMIEMLHVMTNKSTDDHAGEKPALFSAWSAHAGNRKPWSDAGVFQETAEEVIKEMVEQKSFLADGVSFPKTLADKLRAKEAKKLLMKASTTPDKPWNKIRVADNAKIIEFHRGRLHSVLTEDPESATYRAKDAKSTNFVTRTDTRGFSPVL